MTVITAGFDAVFRLLHIEDHPPLCFILQQLIEGRHKSLDISACHCFTTALKMINESAIDLIVLDLRVNGKADLGRIKACSEAAPTIIWSALYTYGTLRTALEYGAAGYIGKHEPLELLVRAIETVHSHKGLFLSKQGQNILAGGGMSSLGMRPGYQDLGCLSKRELHVLDLIAQGYDIKHIAEELNVKRKTIDTFRHRIREKLQLDSSHELVIFALEWQQQGRPLYMKFEPARFA